MGTQRVALGVIRISRWFLITTLKFLLLLIGRDIFLHRRSEARTHALARREAQSRMNEFLSIASHELKTPLTSIKGNIQLMARRVKQSVSGENIQFSEAKSILDEMRELLDKTDQQINRMTHLVNSLIEGSRIHTNTMELLYEICELDALVRDVIRDERYVPTHRTVHIEVANDNTLVVLADTNRIRQVIINYLSNAHKFSALDRPIEVILRENGHMAHIAVRDEGPGIPDEERCRIWERFYRVPHIDVKNGSEVGLGLGLHICRTVVEQHRGHVGLESTPGKGSTFWFELPLLPHTLNTL